MALGYPDQNPKAREAIAVDRIVDSLNDDDLALKIRERTPTTLDEALKAGLQQEVWNKDTARLRTDDRPNTKAVRAAKEYLLRTVNQKTDQLQKQPDQAYRRRLTPAPATDRGPGPTPANTPTQPAVSPMATGSVVPQPAITPPSAGPVTLQSTPNTPPSTPPSTARAGPSSPLTKAGPCWNC